MKINATILGLCIAIFSHAQEKGIAPIANSKESGVDSQKSRVKGQESIVKNTYAVVVGISDYQDPAIPDLKFADKDAEAFANYLRSPAGGKLDKDHLKVLINQQATMAQFGIALDWLIENAKEGDQAIIYFSGHGDVEKKTLTQPGFLLCYDAPARVYMAGGVFSLPMLQEIISTLSIQNKSNVIVITDACHSGKLAGNAVGGAQATASNLAKQYANEIKIMSCQPSEYSIEGEQWGGGRGAFSYHLIDALYGLADTNDDQWVSLQEVGRYLEDHVSTEVAPLSQVPLIIGERNTRICMVDPSLLNSIRNGKTNQMAMLTQVESKGIEEQVLSNADTSVRLIYQQFKSAINEKRFLSPENNCAEYFYQKLIKESTISKLHSTITRNYAAALQDDAQGAINKILISDASELMRTYQRLSEIYNTYPKNLQRAAELLGSSHYMNKTLLARMHYFKGLNFINGSKTPQNPDSTEAHNAKMELRMALNLQADLPYVYVAMISVNKDSAEYYTMLAANQVPNWILPYTTIASLYPDQITNADLVRIYLNKADQIDSNSRVVMGIWATFLFYTGNLSEAERKITKVLNTKDGKVCIPCSYQLLAIIHSAQGKLELGAEEFKKLLLMDSTDGAYHYNYGVTLTLMKKYDEAESETMKSIQYKYGDLGGAYYQLACIYSRKGEIKKSLNALESAFNNAYKDFNWLQKDSDMDLLRKQSRWNELMKKYFPEKAK